MIIINPLFLLAHTFTVMEDKCDLQNLTEGDIQIHI